MITPRERQILKPAGVVVRPPIKHVPVLLFVMRTSVIGSDVTKRPSGQSRQVFSPYRRITSKSKEELTPVGKLIEAGDLTLYILRRGCASTFQMVFVCEAPCLASVTRLFAAPDE
jgi:hypothetical protein